MARAVYLGMAADIMAPLLLVPELEVPCSLLDY